MNIKTSELTGAALILAVQQCEASRKDIDFAWWTEEYDPTTNWAQGGPIIGRVGISITHQVSRWAAQTDDDLFAYGPTPLVAAMRCYVAFILGDEVDVPEELKAIT